VCAGVGPQQRLGQFPPSSTASANQFQPVGNSELRQRAVAGNSQFQPFSNNNSSLFMGGMDDLSLQQRSNQFQPVGSSSAAGGNHFQRSLTPNSMSSATLPMNLQQPNQQQQSQQQIPMNSPNRLVYFSFVWKTAGSLHLLDVPLFLVIEILLLSISFVTAET
jgi:hypothetical protein